MAEGFAEASEPVVGGGVSLSLPVNMLEELESLTDVLSLHTWRTLLSEEERQQLRAHLPRGTGEGDGEELDRLLGGDPRVYFGNPVAGCWAAVRAGLTHPRVARYDTALRLLRRTAHQHQVREYHNRFVNKLLEARDVFELHPQQALPLRLSSLHQQREEMGTLGAKGSAEMRHSYSAGMVAALPAPGAQRKRARLAADTTQ